MLFGKRHRGTTPGPLCPIPPSPARRTVVESLTFCTRRANTELAVGNNLKSIRKSNDPNMLYPEQQKGLLSVFRCCCLLTQHRPWHTVCMGSQYIPCTVNYRVQWWSTTWVCLHPRRDLNLPGRFSRQSSSPQSANEIRT